MGNLHLILLLWEVISTNGRNWRSRLHSLQPTFGAIKGTTLIRWLISSTLGNAHFRVTCFANKICSPRSWSEWHRVRWIEFDEYSGLGARSTSQYWQSKWVFELRVDRAKIDSRNSIGPSLLCVRNRKWLGMVMRLFLEPKCIHLKPRSLFWENALSSIHEPMHELH